MGTRVMVVEDEEAIAAAVVARLAKEGFEVHRAADGVEAVSMCKKLEPSLVVLDVMLPGLDGLEVCRRIQAERPLPVLMLTARDSETDVLVGLGVGADDYMTKPFSPRELVARVRALLRRAERTSAYAGAHIRLGDLVVDGSRRRIFNNGREVHLTPIEFDLVHHLAARPGVVLTRDQLLTNVWGYSDTFGARTVDSHIAAVRRKLGAELIRTVHGVGYALEPPGE
jgi:DNA-binding response OmpR family regulator